MGRYLRRTGRGKRQVKSLGGVEEGGDADKLGRTIGHVGDCHPVGELKGNGIFGEISGGKGKGGIARGAHDFAIEMPFLNEFDGWSGAGGEGPDGAGFDAIRGDFVDAPVVGCVAIEVGRFEEIEILLDEKRGWVGGAEVDAVGGGVGSRDPGEDLRSDQVGRAAGWLGTRGRGEKRRLVGFHDPGEIGFDEIDSAGGSGPHLFGVEDGEDFHEEALRFRGVGEFQTGPALAEGEADHSEILEVVKVVGIVLPVAGATPDDAGLGNEGPDFGGVGGISGSPEPEEAARKVAKQPRRAR